MKKYSCKNMKVLYLILFLILFQRSYAYNEIIKVLNAYKDLNSMEQNALLPFYIELQKQHDYLLSLELQNDDGSSPVKLDSQSNDAIYEAAFKDMKASFAYYLNEDPTIVYDTTLPTVEELLGNTTNDISKLSTEEQLELLDIESIMEDIISEAQDGINDMVQRALDMEGKLLKLNRPKIVIGALNGLGVMWQYWERSSRAAYCSYSHVPQMTEALHNVNGGIQCYMYTAALIVKIQHETEESIKTIKKNVFDLVAIYKKIAAKRTIVGKIMSGTLNLFRALRRVHDIIAVGIEAHAKINNELPHAALKSAECGANFILSVPQMIETAQNLTSCIVFVDQDKPNYEFIKPESDRYWNTGLNVPEL